MSMKLRPDYINPLTAMNAKKAGSQLNQPFSKPTDKVAELRTKQQQLQNQMLLLKASGTDNAGASADTQKVLEEELKQVNTALRSAKANPVLAADEAEPSRPEKPATGTRHNRDRYEPEQNVPLSPGIYQVKKDEEQGRKISFLPYSEG